jgi:hypothetical protein
MATGIAWVDRVVEEANFPPTTDREGAALILGQLLGFTPSPHTVRSWEIPYKVVGKYARYQVNDLIEYARARIKSTPVRTGPKRAADNAPVRQSNSQSLTQERPP